MTQNHWDPPNTSPDLSRLPPQLREALNQPIPLRPDEKNAAVMLFNKTVGMNHPNGRCNVVPFKRVENSVVAMEKGLQLDFSEFTGRVPLATVIINFTDGAAFAASVLRAYLSLGGDLDVVLNAVNTKREQTTRTEYFEEQSNE